MGVNYSTKVERKMKYKHGINHREISFSSKRTTKLKLSRSKHRSNTVKVWLTILVIIRLALEVAVGLIGSGKCRKMRLLPELVLR